MGETRQLSYLVIQKARLSPFFSPRVISIKPWGVAAARGVGVKREGEPCGEEKEREKKKTGTERERERGSVCEKPPDIERSGCVCTR